MPPAKPTNNTTTPKTTLSKFVFVIKGWKNPASNAKNTTRYMYLNPLIILCVVSLNVRHEFDCEINFKEITCF